jgi:hypothetical protein
MLKKIDDYYLNMPVREVFDLRELTAAEYKEFAEAGVIRSLKDEHIYRGHDVGFLGAVWTAFIGSTEGMIYRIALQAIIPDVNSADKVFESAYQYVCEEMGTCDATGPGPVSFWRNIPEGNVILERGCYERKYFVQMCITSAIIRHQTREMAGILFKCCRETRRKAADQQ